MKKEIQITFLLAIVLILASSLTHAYFAPIAIEKGIEESFVGVIISINPLILILITPFYIDVINRIGRRKILIISLFIQVLSNFCYGLITLIESRKMFLICTLMVRIVSGIFLTFTYNLIISIPAYFSDPEDMNTNYAVIDLGWGLGRMCGPSIASFLYSWGGIVFTYTITSIVLLILTIFISQINFKDPEGGLDKKQNFIKAIFKPDILILAISEIVNSNFKYFFSPTFTSHVMKKFEISIETASRIQSISFITYYFLLRYFDFIIMKFGVQLILITGVFFSFISANLLGPVQILPQSIYLVMLSFFLMGIPSVAFDIPIIIEINSVMEKNYNYSPDVAHDLSSSISLFSSSIGEVIGSVLGGYLTNYKSFEFSCSIVGLLNLLDFILLICWYRYALCEKIWILLGKYKESSSKSNYIETNNMTEEENFKKVKLLFKDKNMIQGNKQQTIQDLKKINADPFDKRITKTSLLYVLAVGPKAEDEAVCMRNNLKAKIKSGSVKAITQIDL